MFQVRRSAKKINLSLIVYFIWFEDPVSPVEWLNPENLPKINVHEEKLFTFSSKDCSQNMEHTVEGICSSKLKIKLVLFIGNLIYLAMM